ncbi:unnamed protein product, partial [Mesorhabditis belari]|uniref:Translation elongation factor EFTs/EF1B dimerisation domain-containing protein n=1 Tax=Mesorhabditis belari TaxID=2138241 RepID=A0AAF3EHU3_9BILA
MKIGRSANVRSRFRGTAELKLDSIVGHGRRRGRVQGQRGGGQANVFNFIFALVKTADGKSLKEVIAIGVGKLGENISAKRIKAFWAPQDSEFYNGSHPKDGLQDIPMGRFVSLLAMNRKKIGGQFPTERLADQLCQHIIGMRSESLGTPVDPNEAKKQTETAKNADGQDELNEFFQGQTTQMDADETRLLRQSFMLNPSQTVYEYVTGHNASIKDFVRFELGGESSD